MKSIVRDILECDPGAIKLRIKVFVLKSEQRNQLRYLEFTRAALLRYLAEEMCVGVCFQEIQSVQINK